MSVINSILSSIRAIKVYYDNTTSNLSATNVQDALDEISVYGDYHAGWDQIDLAQTVTIKEKKQMHVHGTLENSGTLIVDGKLIILG